MSSIDITEEEFEKVKTLSDFVFFDEYQNKASYPQFEKTFGAFLNSEEISLEKAFKDIVGPKKKFITLRRMINAYMQSKNGKLSKDGNNFFKLFMHKILKIGDTKLGSKSSKGKVKHTKREKDAAYLTDVSVIANKEDTIIGFKLKYSEDIKYQNLYDDKKKEPNIEKMKFVLDLLIDENDSELVAKITPDDEYLFNDCVTQVFGTFSDKIEFIGFKCRTGKTYCTGTPVGTPFIVGKVGSQLQYLSIKTNDAIQFMEMRFKDTPRMNNNLNIPLSQINQQFLNEPEVINEESALESIKDEATLDKYVCAAPVVADDIEGVETRTDYRSKNKSLSNMTAKQEKDYQKKDNKGNKDKKELSLEDILGESKEKVKEKDKEMKTKIESIDLSNWNGKENENENVNKFMTNNRNYRVLMNKVGKSIKDELKLQKEKLEEGNQFNPNETLDTLEKCDKAEKEFEELINATNIEDTVDLNSNKQCQNTPEENWTKFAQKLKIIKTSAILQLIGSVISALTLLKNDANKENNNRMGIEERMKLYKTLAKNKNIVLFLKKQFEGYKLQYQMTEQEQEQINKLSDIDNLSKEELDQRIKAIDKYAKQNKEKSIERRLMIIYSNCIQKRNQILKQEEEKIRQDLIKNTKINESNLKQKDINLRSKAKKKIKDDLDQEINKTQEKKALRLRASKKKNKEPENFEYNHQNRKIAATKPDDTLTFLDQNYPSNTNDKFTDELFPPQVDSLCPVDGDGEFLPPNEALPKDYQSWEKIKWKRAEDIFNTKNYSVFLERHNESDCKPLEITDEDIFQGNNIFDDYFISCVASLCPYSDFIEKLFKNVVVTENGAYGVFLLIDGIWKLVVLDDFFPCKTNKIGLSHFCFGHCRDNEIWLNLLEKAWAKVNGNYLNIGTRGDPEEMYSIICEGHSEKIVIDDNIRNNNKLKNDLWQKLMKYQQYQMLMNCVSDYKDQSDKYAFQEGKTFSIYKLWDLKQHTGKDLKLVNLRNSWSKQEWNGDWNDADSKWTKEIEDIVGKREIREDGDFFMSFDDFCKYIKSIGVSYSVLDYLYSVRHIGKKIHRRSQLTEVTGKGEHNKLSGPQLTKVVIPNDGCDVYFRVIQKNKRFKFWDKTYIENVLQYIMLLDSDFNYIISEANTDTFTCIRNSNLKRGIYYLVTDINYRYIQNINEIDGYNVSAYSNYSIELSRVDDPSVDIQNIIHNASVQMMQKFISGELSQFKLELIEDTYQKGQPIKPEKVSKLNLYKSDINSNRVPYQVFLFENNTNEPQGVTLEAIKSGLRQPFEFYQEDVTDNKVKVSVPANNKKAVLVMKHKNSSNIDIKVTPDDSAKKEELVDFDDNNDDLSVVFVQTPEALDDYGKVNQYYYKDEIGYIVGIDNNTKTDLDIRLVLSGFTVETPTKYKGKNSCDFVLNKKSDKAFRIKRIPKFKGEYYFSFESA